MSEANRTAMVEVDRVFKAFGEKLALQDIQLVVPAGQLFGLLGPNGAGKTTFFRLLMGILKASEVLWLWAGLEGWCSCLGAGGSDALLFADGEGPGGQLGPVPLGLGSLDDGQGRPEPLVLDDDPLWDARVLVEGRACEQAALVGLSVSSDLAHRSEMGQAPRGPPFPHQEVAL